MKTIEDVKRDMQINISEMRNKRITPKMFKHLSSANKTLQQVSLYLETNPREDFIKQEKDRVSKLIKLKESQYDEWCRNICVYNVATKKRRGIFNKEFGITLLKGQLKVLKYIVND